MVMNWPDADAGRRVLQARSEESRTWVYKRSNEVTYQLKMKTSRTIFSEIQKKVEVGFLS